MSLPIAFDAALSRNRALDYRFAIALADNFSYCSRYNSGMISTFLRKRSAQFFAVLTFISVLAVAASAVVVYRQAARGYQQRVEAISVRLLRQTRAIFNSVHFGLVPTLYQLYMDPQMRPLLFQTDITQMELLIATRRLDDLMTAAPYLHSLVTYNDRAGLFYSTEIGRLERSIFPYRELREVLSDIRQFGVYRYMPMSIPSTTGATQPVFAIVIGDTPYVHPQIAACITAFIDEREFRRLYLDDNGPSDTAGIVILDRNGTILSHPDARRFRESAFDDPVLAQVAQRDDEDGWFTARNASEEVLVSYVEKPAMGWRFVSIAPLEGLLADLRTTRNRVILLALIIAAVLFFADYLISRVLSRPLERLASQAREISLFAESIATTGSDQFVGESQSEFDEIDATLRHTRSRLTELVTDSHKRRHVARTDLLRDLIEAPAGSEQAERAEEEDRRWLDDTSFYLSLFRLDGYRRLVLDRGRMFVEEARSQARAVLRDEFPDRSFLTSLESDEIVFVVAVDRPAAEVTRIVERTRQCASRLASPEAGGVPVSFTAALAQHAFPSEQLHDVYRLLLALSQRRYVLGPGCTLEERESSETVEHDDVLRFDAQPIEAAVQTIFEQNGANALKEIRGLARGAVQAGPRTFALFVQMFVATLRRRAVEGLGREFRFPTAFYRLAASPDYVDTIQDFIWIVQRCLDAIADRLENSTDRRHLTLVHDARAYVVDHYGDPALCDDQIAAALGVSTPHLREIFRKFNDMSLSRFTKDHRLEAARTLLVDPDLSTRAVAQRVGMTNANYFLTLFKRHYGCSPTEYRRREFPPIPHKNEFNE